jgi:hypothetical protein
LEVGNGFQRERSCGSHGSIYSGNVGPHLPGDSVFTVSDKSCELEGLLDFLEEDLDGPTSLVEIGDRTGSPVEVVRQERHLHDLAVDQNPGQYATHVDRVRLFALGAFELDDIVAQNALGLVRIELAVDLEGEVVLGSGHPENAALGEVEEVVEVDVGLLEQGDLSVLESGAKLASSGVVVMGGVQRLSNLWTPCDSLYPWELPKVYLAQTQLPLHRLVPLLRDPCVANHRPASSYSIVWKRPLSPYCESRF